MADTSLEIPEPFNTFHLDVGDGHRIYVEESGNPNGVPLIMCHGGPGGRAKPHHRLRVDLAKFRLILFDQRNCGQSLPLAINEPATLATNMPHLLAADMEKIRQHLGIESWHVTGASWGATLALLYTALYPQAVRSLILGKFFIGQEKEWRGMVISVRQLRPLAYRAFVAPFPDLSDADLLQAYATKVLEGTEAERDSFGKQLLATEFALEILTEPPADETPVAPPPTADDLRAATSSNMVYAHYIRHHQLPNGWYTSDAVAAALRGKDIRIIHGACDMLCPLVNIYEFTDHYPTAQLQLAENCGHGVDLNGQYQRHLSAAFAALT